jgi:hypothetical protein
MNVVLQTVLLQRLLEVISSKFYLPCSPLHIEVLWQYTVQKYRLQTSTLRCSAGYVTAELKNFLLESFTERLLYIPLLQADPNLSNNCRHVINKDEI